VAPLILVTGFEPFGGWTINPSWELARALAAERPEVVMAACLPVSWEEVGRELRRLLKEHRPRAVVCLGQAVRPALALERVGVNWARGRDQRNREGGDRPLIPEGPDAYLSTLPLSRMREACRARGVPCYISNSAGTYLCNAAAYLVRHYLQLEGRSATPAGFIHVPLFPEQAADPPSGHAGQLPPPSMDRNTQLKGLLACLDALLEGEPDG